MSEITRYAPGTFCWPELSTNDVRGAKKFYGHVFDWAAADDKIRANGVYTIFELHGKDVAAARHLTPQQVAEGVPPHWLSYVSTDNVDMSLTKAEALGGRILVPGVDVPEVGRIAILEDPTGAIFSLWEGKEIPGIQVFDRPQSLVWTELLCADAAKSQAFYSRLFGWDVRFRDSIVEDDKGPVTYTTFLRDDRPAAGMLQMTSQIGKMPSQWLSYFGVEDVNASHAKVLDGGGVEIVPPSEVPNVGRFSLVQDPQGATFGLFGL